MCPRLVAGLLPATLLAATLAAGLTSCAPSTSVKRYVTGDEPADAAPALTAAQVAADVAVYRRAVDEIAPFPYTYASRAHVDSVAADVVARGARDPLAFFEGMRRIAAAYDASHFFVDAPREAYLDSVRASGAGVLPLVCDLVGEPASEARLVVQRPFRVYAPDHPLHALAGDTLARVNGLDADSLFRAFFRYVGGTEATKRYDLRAEFDTWLFVNGVRGPFTLELRDASGRDYRHDTRGFAYEPAALDSLAAAQAAATTAGGTDGADRSSGPGLRESLRYRVLDDSTAYLRVARWWGFSESELTAYLDSAFADLRARGTTRLLIDSRGNGGGNDRLAYPLLDYLAAGPYDFYADQARKVSPAYNRYFRKHGSMPWPVRQIPYGPAVRLLMHRHPAEPDTYVGTKPGKAPKRHKPKPDGPRFGGEAYLFVDGGTYSSGVSVADAFQAFDMGTVVGTPTGSAPNEHGENTRVRLPNSGVAVTIPSAYYIRANGDAEDGRPVMPEVMVPVSELDAAGAEELWGLVVAHGGAR